MTYIFVIPVIFTLGRVFRAFQAPGKALAHALLLWLYPVSFFFSFLFYTDPGATFFALLCYLLATGRRRGGGWSRRFGSSLVSRGRVGRRLGAVERRPFRFSCRFDVE